MKTIAIFALTVLVGLAAPAMAGTLVYVPMGSADEVLVIDAQRDEVVGRIAGMVEAHGLAGTADGKYLIAGSFADASRDEAALPAKPKAVSEDQHAAHHAKSAAPAAAESASVSFASIIRADDREVVRRVTVPGAVHHAATTADGRFAVMTLPDDDGISVIDLSSFTVIRTIKTGPLPNYVVAGKDGGTIYVSNSGNDTVSEIDTERWIVRRNFALGKSPEHMVMTPDGRDLYVNNVGEGTVSMVSVERGEVVKTYVIGGGLHGIDLSDDGRTLFVAARERDELVAIELASGEMRRAALAPSPYHLATVRGTGKLYVSSAEDNKIWVVDQQTLRPLREIPVPDVAHQMVVVAN